MLQRPDEHEYDPAFAGYISLVPDGPYLDLLGAQTHETREFFEKLSEGAEVTDLLKEQFFGTYGALNDKFGVRWMFRADATKL